MATRFALSAIWSTSRSKNEWRRPDLRAAVLKAAARSGNLAVSCFTLAGTDQLEELGCWRQDRDTGKFGLTLAGLLMFGKHQAIISPGAAPQYLVDFRGYRGRKPQERWADRLFPDGTWEANLFLFYQRSWPKIVADLKVPFTLKGVQRVDETPVHEALREAVVNAMIHSDYKVGGGIVIMRYDDSYMLENPGTLLVSQEQLRRGGVSECRNKSLQRMFMLIGVGEQAGSCFARIQDGWKDQQWRAPRLTEQHEPDRVRLDMPMISLMPQWAFAGLRERIGPDFERLAQPERIALATAMIEGDVTNTRMQDLVKDHPSDITKLLRGLVGRSLLDTDNQRRWTRYRLPASTAPRRDLFSGSDSTALVPELHWFTSQLHWFAGRLHWFTPQRRGVEGRGDPRIGQGQSAQDPHGDNHPRAVQGAVPDVGRAGKPARPFSPEPSGRLHHANGPVRTPSPTLPRNAEPTRPSLHYRRRWPDNRPGLMPGVGASAWSGNWRHGRAGGWSPSSRA